MMVVMEIMSFIMELFIIIIEAMLVMIGKLLELEICFLNLVQEFIRYILIVVIN